MEIEIGSMMFICMSCGHKKDIMETGPRHRQIFHKDFDINFDSINAHKYKDDNTTYMDENSICVKCKQFFKYMNAGGNSRILKVCECE